MFEGLRCSGGEVIVVQPRAHPHLQVFIFDTYLILFTSRGLSACLNLIHIHPQLIVGPQRRRKDSGWAWQAGQQGFSAGPGPFLGTQISMYNIS